jgi:hypothetical protein
MGIKILSWFILSYGLMNIMVFGSIFQGLRNFFQKWGDNPRAPFRFLGEFISGILSCPMCFSTWGGFVLSLLIFSPTHELFNTPLFCSWFFDGVMSSGAVWVINSIIEWFEENRPVRP